MPTRHLVFSRIIIGCLTTTIAALAQIETPHLGFHLLREGRAYEIRDKAAGVSWQSHPERFGRVTLIVGGKPQVVSLTQPEAKISDQLIHLDFYPLGKELGAIRVEVKVVEENRALSFSYSAEPNLQVESLQLLDEALGVSESDRAYVVVPVREGLLVPANSGLSFTQRFDTYAYEGCHMQMIGLVQNGAAALVTWDDPYVAAELRSVLSSPEAQSAKQKLLTSLVLRKSARSFRIHPLGKGDYVTVAKAYREIAKARGLLVTWEEKLKGHPERAQYFGASNYKIWSVLDRRMNDDSSKEERVRVNWTFQEAAEVAEHLKHDLKLERVLFMMGGWIHRGYDNQHPDILPTAPECGGDAAFSEACQRIRSLGYLLSLHDNYQDIYRDSPSWDERWIQKNLGGGLSKGGSWAGGRAYITCSKMALELARRPQNLALVKKLSGAASYFIDTTYAAGLQECFDAAHPLTRAEDMKWKQALSDYAREVFGSFGSECGREWAIPHADFFEGMTGVSGSYYHNKDLVKNLGAVVVPLFELVYRDCIAMYGKYGYDPATAAEYVLHHIAIGRPLHYHNIPAHLYWKTPARAAELLSLRPAVRELKQKGPGQFSVTYRWNVEKAARGNWRVFVHFTDAAGNIQFQNDYTPATPVSEWQVGLRTDGPFDVALPPEATGVFKVRMGLYEPRGQARARLLGDDDGERSHLVGKLSVRQAAISFEPEKRPDTVHAGDPALYTRADGGWAEGRHLHDRFLKNTHEILSPLNEITSRLPMTEHEFLTPDRKTQRSVFGQGANAVEVIVHAGKNEYACQSRRGGSVVLPPFGFLIESDQFVAFCATIWNGRKYSAPTLFTLRAMEGGSLTEGKEMKVYHGFGDPILRVKDRLETIPTERVVPL